MGTENFEIGKAYMVKWTDNCGTPAGWIDLEEQAYSAEVPKITSYGVLINKSKDAIVLAQSYNKGGESIKKQAMGIVVISTACINDIQEITFSCLDDSCQDTVSEHSPQASS